MTCRLFGTTVLTIRKLIRIKVRLREDRVHAGAALFLYLFIRFVLRAFAGLWNIAGNVWLDLPSRHREAAIAFAKRKRIEISYSIRWDKRIGFIDNDDRVLVLLGYDRENL